MSTFQRTHCAPASFWVMPIIAFILLWAGGFVYAHVVTQSVHPKPFMQYACQKHGHEEIVEVFCVLPQKRIVTADTALHIIRGRTASCYILDKMSQWPSELVYASDKEKILLRKDSIVAVFSFRGRKEETLFLPGTRIVYVAGYVCSVVRNDASLVLHRIQLSSLKRDSVVLSCTIKESSKYAPAFCKLTNTELAIVCGKFLAVVDSAGRVSTQLQIQKIDNEVELQPLAFVDGYIITYQRKPRKYSEDPALIIYDLQGNVAGTLRLSGLKDKILWSFPNDDRVEYSDWPDGVSYSIDDDGGLCCLINTKHGISAYDIARSDLFTIASKLK